MPSPVLQRIFHSFALLVSTAICGAVLGGVVGSLVGNQPGFDAIATVMGGIGLGGGLGLVLAAGISMRASIETLMRYSRIAMVLAILFMAMLFVRRYRIDQSLREEQIEIVPVKLALLAGRAGPQVASSTLISRHNTGLG
jgi:hypothetical protein